MFGGEVFRRHNHWLHAPFLYLEQIKMRKQQQLDYPPGIASVTFTSTPELGYTHTNSFDFTLKALPLSPLPHQVMASASQTPLRPQYSVTVTVGDDSNKK